MRRALHCWAWTVLVVTAATPAFGQAESGRAARKGADTHLHRNLTGKLGAVKDGGQVVTLEVPEGAVKSWPLAVGKQTLIMTANKNGQFSRMEPGDLKKGETAQAMVAVTADGETHKTWWLIVFPAGTTPPAP